MEGFRFLSKLMKQLKASVLDRNLKGLCFYLFYVINDVFSHNTLFINRTRVRKHTSLRLLVYLQNVRLYEQSFQLLAIFVNGDLIPTLLPGLFGLQAASISFLTPKILGFAVTSGRNGCPCIVDMFWAVRTLLRPRELLGSFALASDGSYKTTFVSSFHQGLLRRESRNRSD